MEADAPHSYLCEGIMKKAVLFLLLLIPLNVDLFRSSALPDEKKAFSLKEDLSLGVVEGDDNLMFGSVADIGLDALGRIYILDRENWRIQKFTENGDFISSLSIKQGQGPSEVSMLTGMAVSQAGLVFLLDRGANKIVVLNADGAFVHQFILEFQAAHLGCLEGERVAVLGLHQGKILHVFDAQGRLEASFGDPFEVPAALSRHKDMPLLRMPMRFNTSPEGRIFVLNPHRFEVSVFEKGKLVKKLAGKSDLFQPAWIQSESSQRMAVIFPWVSALESGNRYYLAVYRVGGKEQNELIIYENEGPVGSLRVDGFPRAVDGQGRLYFADETAFPRMIRYTVSEK